MAWLAKISGDRTTPAVWPGRLLVMLAALTLAGPGRAADGWAQLAATIFVTLGRDQGLPHPAVTGLAQDRHGFLWAGTQGGLVRWDGDRFTSFAADENDPSALPSPVIADLATDGDGRLWVASIAGDIARYDDERNEFDRFPAPVGHSRGTVTVLVGDGHHGVWVGGSTGLEHVDGARDQVSQFRHGDNDDSRLPGNAVTALVRRGDDSLWVATDHGLAFLASHGEIFVAVPLYGPGGAALSDTITGLAEDSAGVLWFVTAHSAVGRIEAGPGTTPVGRQRFDLTTTSGGGPGSSRLIEGRAGDLWIGRTASGITVLTPGTGAIRQITPQLGVGTSLADGMVRSLFKDRTGRIWVATNRGISRTDPDNAAIETILPSDHPGAFRDNDVLAVAFDPAGQVWLGLKDRGLAMIDPVAGRLSPVAGIRAGISSLAVAADGMLWAGSYTGQAIYRIDPGTGAIRPQPVPAGGIGAIRSISPVEGRLWLAAGTLIDFDPTLRQSRIYRHDSATDSPNDDSVDIIMPTADGQLWLGTRRGLDLFSPARGSFRHISHDAADSTSLPGSIISSLLTDRQGRLWVGTLGNGIGLSAAPMPADGTAPRFRRLTSAEGLPSDNIGGILEDRRGFIWVSTANGLAVIDPDSLRVRPLQLAEGVAIPAYWVGAAARSRDGALLLFGGSGGLTVVHPDRLGAAPGPPPVVVTAIHVDGQAVVAGAYRSGQPLTLTPRQRSLTVDFAAPESRMPERLRYHYRLEGFDDVGHAWSEVDSSHRSASYTNLPPGPYRLVLQTSEGPGPWSPATSLAITVQPAWWQTLWGITLLMGAGLAAITLLVQGRTMILRRRSRLLEQLVAEQTRSLTEANRHLSQLATTDPLTGLLNRRAFTEMAQRELENSRRGQRISSLLMLDLDHFKRVNDTFGHAGGDQVLISVSRTIGAVLRGEDLLGRLGGEELAVFLPEANPAGARIVAEKLRLAVSGGVHLLSHPDFAVTISVGVTSSGPGDTLATLLERADAALYDAKHSGRNRVVAAAAIIPDLVH